MHGWIGLPERLDHVQALHEDAAGGEAAGRDGEAGGDGGRQPFRDVGDDDDLGLVLVLRGGVGRGPTTESRGTLGVGVGERMRAAQTDLYDGGW